MFADGNPERDINFDDIPVSPVWWLPTQWGVNQNTSSKTCNLSVKHCDIT